MDIFTAIMSMFLCANVLIGMMVSGYVTLKLILNYCWKKSIKDIYPVKR